DPRREGRDRARPRSAGVAAPCGRDRRTDRRCGDPAARGRGGAPAARVRHRHRQARARVLTRPVVAIVLVAARFHAHAATCLSGVFTTFRCLDAWPIASAAALQIGNPNRGAGRGKLRTAGGTPVCWGLRRPACFFGGLRPAEPPYTLARGDPVAPLRSRRSPATPVRFFP